MPASANERPCLPQRKPLQIRGSCGLEITQCKDSETMTGRQAPKRSKQVLTSGESFNLLIHANTRSTQIEPEHYVRERQAFGPIRARTRLPLGLTASVLRGLERARGMERWSLGGENQIIVTFSLQRMEANRKSFPHFPCLQETTPNSTCLH